MKKIIIIGILCFIAQTASAQPVPTAAPVLKFKQALGQENARYSKDWHKRLKEINYDTSQKKAVLKQQFTKNYHSTRDPNQRKAYWDSYVRQLNNVINAGKQQWAKDFEGLQDTHNYNIEQIYKAYGIPYTLTPAK